MGPTRNPGQPAHFGMPNNPFTDPRSGPQIPGNPIGQGPSKMDGYMQTANRFLNTAQQFAPVVQQFAPMMKNLPAMWKLYKGFQSIPAAGAGPAAGSVASRAAQTAAQSAAPIAGPRPSMPRIYQPTNL